MVPNEVLKEIKVRAAVAWPGDYSMQAHVIGEQVEAAGDFFNAEFPGVPEDVLQEIRARAFSEWPEDYSMMLHELTGQIEGWKSVNF